MTHFEYDDNRIVREARTTLDPWSKQGITEQEYNERLDSRQLKEFEARKKEVKELFPKLLKINQGWLAHWIAWQFRADWNSYDLKNGLRAAQLMVHGDKRMAKLILDGIIGLLVEEPRNTSNSVHPTPFAPEGNVKYTGDMRLELDDKHLLSGIGSEFKRKKNKRK
jgi:hypothetical protein